ncbi:MAG TPA: hypothetical protein VKC57_02275, partial [Ktedonobacterales bacterium]|nr:hypothetical protein [Ktedonobacterales bacterium]
ERARRSRLASWIILGLFVADAALLPLGIGDTGSEAAVLILALGLVSATVLNHAGQVGFAGALIALLITAGAIGAVVSYPAGLTLDALPAFDLMAVSVLVAASLLPRRAAFIVAAINIALITTDFVTQPHAADLKHELADATLYPSPTVATIALLARPIALQIILSVVAYLWVRGTDDAIRRADRAEEIAALEHKIAEQKRQLDYGVQQILQTHIRAANGDFGARAPLGQDNALWQISSSLNNLLARLQRAGNAEYRLQRTEEELQRLAAALQDAQSGRRPIWPAPSGTSVDPIIEIITGSSRRSPMRTGWLAAAGSSAVPALPLLTSASSRSISTAGCMQK